MWSCFASLSPLGDSASVALNDSQCRGSSCRQFAAPDTRSVASSHPRWAFAPKATLCAALHLARAFGTTRWSNIVVGFKQSAAERARGCYLPNLVTALPARPPCCIWPKRAPRWTDEVRPVGPLVVRSCATWWGAGAERLEGAILNAHSPSTQRRCPCSAAPGPGLAAREPSRACRALILHSMSGAPDLLGVGN